MRARVAATVSRIGFANSLLPFVRRAAPGAARRAPAVGSAHNGRQRAQRRRQNHRAAPESVQRSLMRAPVERGSTEVPNGYNSRLRPVLRRLGRR